jgi:hypothetical protein
MSEWIILAASAAVVALMVLVAALLGFRERVAVTEAELTRLAEAEGDQAERALVDAEGRLGIALLRSGKVLIARAMGDGIGARELGVGAVRAKRVSAGVRLDVNDIGFPPVVMRMKHEPPAWLLNLGASR